MSESKRTSRLLTLVFTDVVDSTALKAKHGDFRAGELLARDRNHVDHSMPTQGEMIREVLAWLEEYEHGVPGVETVPVAETATQP